MSADHLVALGDEWALWRDFAIRSAGFPVSGLHAFGPGDEAARLRAVASDPRFREAVTWQNRAARHTAVDKVASGSPTSGSKQRQRLELVANYWQRYCAKNDTIGFFGPLAWGTFADDGDPLTVRWDPEPGACEVHFEAWCFEVLTEALGLDVQIPLGPHPERDVRAQLERLPAGDARTRGLDALDRLEARRQAVADASPADLDGALADLDRVFEEVTGQASTRRGGTMYGARTLVYLDCMRAVHVGAGPALRTELATTLPALLAASRWYCGKVFESLSGLVHGIARSAGNGPLMPVLGPALGAILAVPPEVPLVNAELQRRWASLLVDPDVTTLAARAAVTFADHTPGWPFSVFHSPDLQVAAASLDAVAAGEFLCVLGDFHPGTNTLGQGLFATRFPDRARFLDMLDADAGPPAVYLIPPRTAERMTSRIMPAITRPHQVHVAATPDACMPEGYRVVQAAELVIEDGMVAQRDGTALGPITELLQAPMFVAGVRTYNPFPVEAHAPRLTLSRTVLRRETWQVAAGEAPSSPEALREWASGCGVPRRSFLLSPIEAKPVYLDLESPVLTGIVARLVRRAAAAQPGGMIRVTEMLPTPDQCWLTDPEGRRYTSELRLAAVDLARRASAATR